MKSLTVGLAAASVVTADSFTGKSGNTLQDMIASSYVKIRATMDSKRVTINVEQSIKTSADLKTNEEGEMFVCFARKTVGSDECIVTSWKATNPDNGVYTIKNSSYTKTTAHPAISDFTTDKSFTGILKGFATGSSFTLKYA